jgi:hypothetical protein
MDTWIAIIVLVVGGVLIWYSLHRIGEIYLPRCKSDALRMYYEGRMQIIAAIGFIFVISGFGMGYRLNDPEEVGLMNLVFLLALVLSVYWMYDGLAKLDEAKKLPLEEG